MRVALVVCLVATASSARADDLDGDGIDDDSFLIHHPAEKWWVSGQVNVILQAQPGFHSPYEGSNSFRSTGPGNNEATSVVTTVYGAYEVTPYTAVELAVESAGGNGLSTALGLAGFTNVDVVRNPSLGPAPYIGRALIDQIIPLTSERAIASRAPFDTLRSLPVRRIEIRAGKFGTVDAFDGNDVGTDSHRQFLNWTIDNNGAYDYAADTRGYTLGVVVEYASPLWAIRFGEMLMPTVANGIDYDFDIAHARGENAELEIHDCIAGHPGVLKLLGFLNHANMGSYADAIAEFRSGITDTPDIVVTRLRPPIVDSGVALRTKYGIGVNELQQVTDNMRAFGRFGWADGLNESFAYTEVDNTLALGFDLRGVSWNRPLDQIGVAGVTNGLSDLHRTYLALGGKGFLLGDGMLNYGREDILEAYYTAHVYRGVFPAADIQLIENPGYNRDRGPAVVFSLRLHLEI